MFLWLSFLALLILPLSVKAEELVDRLQGRILLQTESNGEAWYVNPSSKERSYLGRPEDVFRVMREFGLGIKKTELQSYLDSSFPERLAGRIMLNVEGLGEAYYISPDDLRGHYLGSPSQAFQVVRQKAIGITNNNINKIKVVDSSVDRLASQAEQKPVARKNEDRKEPTPSPVASSTSPIISDDPGQCTFWTYSPWGDCSDGLNTRQVLSALPAGCSGGEPEVSKPCVSGVCTSWRYTDWFNCSDGYQRREIVESFPISCVGGESFTLKACGNDITCSAWTYSDWSPCSDGNQTRTVVTSSPDGCVGGQPVLTQTCDTTSDSPYSPYQFSYTREMGPLYDPHLRIVFISEPNENIKIIKIPVTGYYRHGTFNDTLPDNLSYSVNYIQDGQQMSVEMSRLDNQNYLFEAGTPIPLNLGDHNSVTIKASNDYYSAINDISKWVIWDYSVNKPVWLGN